MASTSNPDEGIQRMSKRVRTMVSHYFRAMAQPHERRPEWAEAILSQVESLLSDESAITGDPATSTPAAPFSASPTPAATLPDLRSKAASAKRARSTDAKPPAAKRAKPNLSSSATKRSAPSDDRNDVQPTAPVIDLADSPLKAPQPAIVAPLIAPFVAPPMLQTAALPKQPTVRIFNDLTTMPINRFSDYTADVGLWELSDTTAAPLDIDGTGGGHDPPSPSSSPNEEDEPMHDSVPPFDPKDSDDDKLLLDLAKPKPVTIIETGFKTRLGAWCKTSDGEVYWTQAFYLKDKQCMAEWVIGGQTIEYVVQDLDPEFYELAKASMISKYGSQIALAHPILWEGDLFRNDMRSVQPVVRPSDRTSSRPYDRPSVRPSVRPTVRPTVRPSVRPSDRPSVRSSVHREIPKSILLFYFFVFS